jgi:hypothetical protein
MAEGFAGLKLPEASHNENFHNEFMDFVTAFTPGVVRPVVELERNKNNFGGTIAPSEEFTKGYHSASGFRSTPQEWKWLAEQLRTWSGGAIDVYPESLEYLTAAYGTGPASGVLRAIAAEQKGKEGEDTGDIPYIPSPYSKDADYYEARRLKEMEEDLKQKVDTKTASKKEEAVYKTLESVSREYNKEKKAVYDNKLLSDEAKSSKLKQISDRQKREQTNLLNRIGS